MTDDNLSIIIHELVKAGDLRQDNPSHYNRIEWLIIHNACKKDREQSDDNDGGDNSPPSMVICVQAGLSGKAGCDALTRRLPLAGAKIVSRLEAFCSMWYSQERKISI